MHDRKTLDDMVEFIKDLTMAVSCLSPFLTGNSNDVVSQQAGSLQEKG